MEQEPERQQQDRSREDVQDLLAVHETLRGRKRAFDSIVERYTPALYSLSYRMLGRSEDAEEAVQEIFMKAYRSLPKFRLSRRFYPWIYTIAINHLRSLARKKRAKFRPRILRYDQELLATLPASGNPDPADVVERAEVEKLIADAIQALKPVYKEVFLLRQVEGMPVRDVAEIMDLPEGTVKTYLHRARVQLTAILTKVGLD